MNAKAHAFNAIEARFTELEAKHRAAIAELEAKHRGLIAELEAKIADQADELADLRGHIEELEAKPDPDARLVEIADRVAELINAMDSGLTHPIYLAPLRAALRATGRHVEPRLD